MLRSSCFLMMVFLQTHMMRGAECLLTGLVMCAVGGVIFSAPVMKKNTIGIVGLGKIGNAVARGFAGAKLDVRPQQIIVSPRNEKKAALLKQDFPDLITIAKSNEEVVRMSNTIFVGLLPDVAREVLPTLPFTPDHSILSMMAAVDYDEVVQLCRQNKTTGPIIKIIPLTGAAQRSGPILFHPPHPELESLVSVIGTPIPCATETELKPLISITGQISPFYRLLDATQQWALSQGIPAEEARLFISSFYAGLANTAFNCDKEFSQMSSESATPGGLNEQSVNYLKKTDFYELHEHALDDIAKRLSE